MLTGYVSKLCLLQGKFRCIIPFGGVNKLVRFIIMQIQYLLRTNSLDYIYMKKITLILLWLFPLITQAQSFWSLVEDYSGYNISHITDKAILGDSIILTCGYVSDASCPGSILSAYSKSGESLWGTGGYHDIVTTESNYIYTVGYGTTYDDVGGFESVSFSKYDKDGNEIFKIEYPEIPHFEYYYRFSPKNIEFVSDSTILISSSQSIIKSDINGSTFKEHSVKLESDINAIYSLSPVAYIISTQNKIYKTDSSFALLDSIQFDNTISSVKLINDTIYSLLINHLVKVDTNLKVIDTVFSSKQSIDAIEFYDNQIWVQTQTSDSITLFQIKSKNERDSLTFPRLIEDPRFIVSGNEYTFIGNSFSNQIGIYSFQIENNNIVSPSLLDIEIIDFTIESIELRYQKWYNGDTIISGFRFQPSVTIKNNSSEPLHSFAIYSELFGGMNCAQNHFYQKNSNLNILPGETQTVLLSQAYQSYDINEFCFQCMAPNSELETEIDNNTLCKTVSITSTPNKELAKVKIYPTLVKDKLFIEQLGSGHKKIKIINLKGEEIITTDTKDSTTEVNTSNLPSGTYFIEISVKDNSITQLFIKQ